MTDATIRFNRTWSLYGFYHKVNVMVDGKKICALSIGKEAEVNVPPGAHVVEIEIGGRKSATLNLDLTSGEKRQFECGVIEGSKLFQGCITLYFLAGLVAWYLDLCRLEHLPVITVPIFLFLPMPALVPVVFLVPFRPAVRISEIEFRKRVVCS